MIESKNIGFTECVYTWEKDMYRLIIADDELVIRNGIATAIAWKELGFEVVGRFDDGKDVIKYLENNTVDVVFTDVEMYDVSGLEVASWVAEHCPHVIVVIISGYKEFDYVKEAISSNVYDYILKPINPEEIKRVFLKIRKKLDEEKPQYCVIDENDNNIEKQLNPEKLVEYAKEYIESHISDELTVDAIAQKVYMSRSHFAREFKRITDVSVMDYVINRRMERAILMLRNGERSQSKVAEAVGYKDLKYFQRSFKKYTGHTIKEYQRLLHY